MNIERAKVVKAYHDIIVGEDLDAILMPGYQAVAPRHDSYGLPVYTVLQNLVNYPCGIVPFGKAEKERDRAFLREGVEYIPPCKSISKRGWRE